MEDQNIRLRKEIVHKSGNSMERANTSQLDCTQALEVYDRPWSPVAFRKESSLEYCQLQAPMLVLLIFCGTVWHWSLLVTKT